MRWTNEHDVVSERIWFINLGNINMDHKNEERYGKKVAESLNGLNSICELHFNFKVTHRSERDRYKLLVDNF